MAQLSRSSSQVSSLISRRQQLCNVKSVCRGSGSTPYLSILVLLYISCFYESENIYSISVHVFFGNNMRKEHIRTAIAVQKNVVRTNVLGMKHVTSSQYNPIVRAFITFLGWKVCFNNVASLHGRMACTENYT